MLATAGFGSGAPHPMVHHTPLPPRPAPDYADKRRYARLMPSSPGQESIVRVSRPIDLVKLRRERRVEHQVALQHESRARSVLKRAGSQGPVKPAALLPSVTGIWPWWTYEERSIPGVGQAMVNVANLNFLYEENDVDIPEGGIDLAFRRIYNSESNHDWTGTDGSTPSVYGNRWTNNLDTHLAASGSGNSLTISVYTGDGARDDYTCNVTVTTVCASNTPGIYDLLAPTQLTGTGGVACQFQWTKKSGTSYIFNAPYAGCSGIGTGFQGRLLTIYARNENFYIQLGYSWKNSDNTNPENLTQVTATHQPDGNALTLTFGLVQGPQGNVRELTSLTRPDGQTLYYFYNTNVDLDELTKPSNNPVLGGETMPSSFLDGNPIAQGTLPEVYNIEHPGLMEVCGPRATISMIDNNPNSPTDGACVDFDYSNHQLSDWYTRGVLNPTPADNVISTPIQSGPNTGFVQWDDTTFFNNSQSSNCTAQDSLAEMSDAFNHATEWCYDSNSRVTQTSDEVQSSSWLTTQENWDANNNLTSTIDARNHETDMAYDSNGNTLEVSLPSEQMLVGGNIETIRPTSLYDYDQYNNVLNYCDPANNPNNSWQPSPQASPCANSGSAHYAKFSFTYSDSNETYGCLTQTQKPGGYATQVSYPGTCGSGLPTKAVAVNAITQADGTSRTPTQKFGYDSAGDLTSYNSYPGDPNGNSAAAWTLSYDQHAMHRLISRTDPDSVTSYWCYNLDGTTLYKETANQHNLDGAPTCPGPSALQNGTATVPTYAVGYGYDADGDVATEAHNHGCNPSGTCRSKATPPAAELCTAQGTNTRGTTCKYYDGLDRLVEVKQPWDGNNPSANGFEVYSNPWITRYLYDLTGSQYTFKSNGKNASFSAYGNLYETQELLPSSGWTTATSFTNLVTNGTYIPIKATAYDGLDRTVGKYSLVASSSGSGQDNLNSETLTWDTTPVSGDNISGLLGEDCNAVGQCQEFDYQADGKESVFESSDGSSPKRTYTYDPDDRPAQITEGGFNNPQTYGYDVDGNLTTGAEASGASNFTSAATLTYEYYPDGKQEYLDVSSLDFSQTHLRSYSYRQDDVVEQDAINDSGVSGDPTAGQTQLGYTYTDAGRVLKRVESGAEANSTQNTTKYQYDTGSSNSDGFLNKQTIPNGATLSSFTYSAESELLQLTPSAGSCPAPNNTYSLRGELAQWMDCSSLYGTGYMANGASLQPQAGWSGPTYVWDGNMGVMSKESGQCGQNPCSSTWTFDQAGQMTSETAPGGGNIEWTIGRCYDAENHVTGNLATDAGSPGNPCSSSANPTSMTWGPNGHPVMITSYDSVSQKTYYETLHWDGNQLLFATSSRSGGVLDNVKIDDQGDITPQDAGYKGLTFYDRGPGGSVMGCHNATGSVFQGVGDSWNHGMHSGTLWLTPCSGASGSIEMPTSIWWYDTPTHGPSVPVVGEGGILGMPRTDGLTDGHDTIQGVRTYDSNAGIWTTPDAYEGDIRDPMSQKPFMWNDNNPVEYQDPSGYEGCEPGTCGIDPINPPRPPANADTFGKVEAHIGGFSASLTVTGRSGSFVSLGGTGNPKTVIKNVISALKSGKVSAGASGSVGLVLPFANQTSGDVVKGGSVGGSIDVGEGVMGHFEGQGNQSGAMAGFGISIGTPGFSASASEGQRVARPPSKHKDPNRN